VRGVDAEVQEGEVKKNRRIRRDRQEPPNGARKYLNEHTIAEAVDRYGVTFNIISRWRRELGLVKPKQRDQRAFYEERYPGMIDMISSGRRYVEIADKYGVSTATVSNVWVAVTRDQPFQAPDDPLQLLTQ
jgi:uncharacterized protein YjcR